MSVENMTLWFRIRRAADSMSVENKNVMWFPIPEGWHVGRKYERYVVSIPEGWHVGREKRILRKTFVHDDNDLD